MGHFLLFERWRVAMSVPEAEYVDDAGGFVDFVDDPLA
jgi:hypothetical protein